MTALATVPLGRDIVVAEDLVLRNGVKVSLHLRGPERSVWSGRTGPARPRCSTPCGGRSNPARAGCRPGCRTGCCPKRLQVLDDDDSVLVAVSRLAPTADDNQLRAVRATLAALLLSEPPPQLLILDEPTNSLDLDSVRQLTEALAQYRGALLVAGHDEAFLADLDLTSRIDLSAPASTA